MFCIRIKRDTSKSTVSTCIFRKLLSLKKMLWNHQIAWLQYLLSSAAFYHCFYVPYCYVCSWIVCNTLFVYIAFSVCFVIKRYCKVEMSIDWYMSLNIDYEWAPSLLWLKSIWLLGGPLRVSPFWGDTSLWRETITPLICGEDFF